MPKTTDQPPIKSPQVSLGDGFTAPVDAIPGGHSDPTTPTSDREQRVRQKAYEIWVAEGKPNDGADFRRWTMAEGLIADRNENKPT
jgi:hypothetical protein